MENTVLQPNVLDKPPKRSKFLFFLIISIVVIIAVFGAWRFLSSKNEQPSSKSTAPTPTEFQLPTESPMPEATKAAKPTSTPTPKPSLVPTSAAEPTVNPVDKTTGLDRSKLTIEVQNGSGVIGAAKKAADALRELGYVISSTGNADNYDYTNVTIQVKSSKNKFLSLLQKDLGSIYTIGTASANLSATSSADALVIVGK